MIQIKVTKEFLYGYREYKIGLLNDVIEENINYKVLESLIQHGKMDIQSMHLELFGYNSITIDLDTSVIVGRSFLSKAYKKT